MSYRPDRRHTPADRLLVRRHHLVQRHLRSTARRPDRRQRKINWSAVTSVITAMTALGALVFTGLSLSASQDQTALAEQSQITDRYSRAIEQLGQQGPDRLQIRLGGIYALERLAHDSPRDQPTIIEVLNTFVRTNVGQTIPFTLKLYPAKCPADVPTSPAPDVQAALTVLGRRDSAHDNNATFDLSRTCLRGADLSGANLTGADLYEANLTGANLTGANLTGANLRGANLTGNLEGTNLTGALHDSRTSRPSVVIYGRPIGGQWW